MRSPVWGNRSVKALRAALLVCAFLGAGAPAVAFAATTQVAQSTSPSLFTSYAPLEARDLAVAKEQQVIRAQPVLLNLSLLTGSAEVGALGTPAQSITLNLFEQTFVADAERVERGEKGVTWIGKLRGVPQSQVVIVTKGEVAAGNIILPGSRYHLRFVGDAIHEIQQIDASLFPPDHPPMRRNMNMPEASAQQTLAAQTDDGSVIDVMVLYTAVTRAAAGGTQAILAQIDLAAAEANKSYENSGVAHRVRVVHTEEVVFNEAKSSDPLADARDCIASKTDGCLDYIHSLRDTHAADLVNIWVEDGGGYCGISFIMNTVSHDAESLGFTAVARSCAVGNYSFAHELGHNMGSRHDMYMDSTPKSHPYSHGYTNPSSAHPWRTVMAYNDACQRAGVSCARIPYWSNPGVLYEGVPMGNATNADNHRSLNENALTVANFRTEKLPGCTYSLSSNGATFSAKASTGTVSLSTNPGCAWTATVDAKWITLTSTASGSGRGEISYSINANKRTKARTGTISIAGQTFTIKQAKPAGGSADDGD